MSTFIGKQSLILFLFFSTGVAVAEEQERWSYFGQVSQSGEIIKSNFTPEKEPAIGDMITVANDISIRNSPPSVGNVMSEKIGALAAGTVVKVVDVLKFKGSRQGNFIWVSTAP